MKHLQVLIVLALGTILGCATQEASLVDEELEPYYQKINEHWIKKDSSYFIKLFDLMEKTNSKNSFYGALYSFGDVSNFQFYRVDSIGEKVFVFKDLYFDDSLELAHKSNIINGLKIYKESKLFLQGNISVDSIRKIRDKYWTSTKKMPPNRWELILNDLNSYCDRNR